MNDIGTKLDTIATSLDGITHAIYYLTFIVAFIGLSITISLCTLINAVSRRNQRNRPL